MNFKKGAFYVLGANIINLIITLFTGFVLPKLLAIETYSNIKLFQLYIGYIGVLHLGYADGVYLKRGGKSKDNIDKKEILEELKTFKVFQLIVTVIAIIISLILKNKMLFFCSLVILPINISGYFKTLYQAIGEFKKYSKFTNIDTILLFFINMILVLLVKTNNYYIYIIAYIIVYLIYWVLLEKENEKIFGKQKVKIKKEYFVNNIHTGFFLMIGNLCNIIFTTIDRIFIRELLGMIKFAFYSFAVSVENLMNVVITPISTVMYNYLCTVKNKKEVIKLKKVLLVFSTIIIAIIFPAKFFINYWLVEYKESINIMVLLFATQYISIIIKCIHINLYKAEKKQNRYFILMISIVILSIILNIIFYKFKNVMEMIALATLITNIIWFIIGEYDFEKYRLTFKEYMFTLIILVLFLICGNIKNAIIGLFIYILVASIFIYTLLNDTFWYCLNEIKNLKYKIINKLRKID